MEKSGHLAALAQILAILEPLENDPRRRVIDTVLTFFSFDSRHPTGSGTWDALDPALIPQSSPSIPFSKRMDLSPKEFLLQKLPLTEVERIACLAFYLTQYRGLDQFKTSDLSALNQDAAQRRFSNAAKTTYKAMQYGYLAPAGKDTKQMSALGERFVIALPDREAAKLALESLPRRSKPRVKTSKSAEKKAAVLTDLRAAGVKTSRVRGKS